MLETDLSGNLQNEYIYFNGTRIARSDSSHAIHYYFLDHLGSNHIVTNSTGSVQQDIDYAPAGTIAYGSPTEHYLFTGKERDTESGLDNFGARNYASSLGRFMRPDEPFADQDTSDPQSWNLYSYVRNNPLNNIDPTGLWCVWEDGTHDATEHNGGASQGDCGAQGGHWDQYNTITGIYQQDGVVTQINTIFDNANGGPCTTANCGAGMTLENFDQTLQTYTQGQVSNAPTDVLPDSATQIFKQVGTLTSPFTKVINCGAAGAIAFSPIPTPDDAEDARSALLDQGVDGAEKGLDALSEASKLSKNARGIAKVGGKVANVAGKALAVHSAYKNMQEEGCFGGKK